eukprot:TRINITY_DN60086_c0_g1_i1.p2 TRINITY_DN60086_c0_g1~~TRINITY_DN60086_c0_g1_i1.p2  ORF type:complete len:161 (-),score=39.36 TRINITY_DN60086_c0_g1_i1:102-584(-)
MLMRLAGAGAVTAARRASGASFLRCYGRTLSSSAKEEGTVVGFSRAKGAAAEAAPAQGVTTQTPAPAAEQVAPRASSGQGRRPQKEVEAESFMAKFFGRLSMLLVAGFWWAPWVVVPGCILGLLMEGNTLLSAHTTTGSASQLRGQNAELRLRLRQKKEE